MSKVGNQVLGRALVVSCALGVMIGAARAEAAGAERTILHHGKIFTANADAPWAEAIAISGERIVAVGSNEEVLELAGASARVIDLGGRTVVPGIDDAHVHALGIPAVPLNDGAFVPGPGPTLFDVLELLALGAASHPAGTWLTVLVGEAFLDDPLATRFALDAVTPSHPVWVQSWTGHGVYVNTAAMAALGVSETEPDPFGGSFVRLPNSDVITGEVHEYAEHRLRRRLLASVPDAALEDAYRAFAAGAVALGITSIQDIPVGLPHARAVKVVSDAALPIRARELCVPLEPGERCALETRGAERMVESHGVKWITDGTPIERLAFVDESYVDRPGWHGAFNFSDAALEALVRSALVGPADREQRLFHAVGDGAIEKIFGAMEAVAPAARWRHRRLRIEHFDLLFPESFARAKALGVVLVQNPTHLALPNVWIERFGPERFAKMESLRSVLEADIPLALGSDSIGRPGNPWLDVFFAAIHPVRASEALTVEQAVTAYTRGAAYAELAEHEKGTLAPGKLADLAVLSQDVFTVPVFALPATHSVLTIVGGEIVWRTPEL